jgi:hypothetical protein
MVRERRKTNTRLPGSPETPIDRFRRSINDQIRCRRALFFSAVEIKAYDSPKLVPALVDSWFDQSTIYRSHSISNCFSPRTATIGSACTIWPTTTQQYRIRIAAKCCLTVKFALLSNSSLM